MTKDDPYRVDYPAWHADVPLPGEPNYTTTFQNQIQFRLVDNFLRPTIGYANKYNVPFWFTPQVHSWTDALREPTTNELKLMVYFSLAYGAKGINYFLYWTIPEAYGLVETDGTPRHTIYSGTSYAGDKWATVKAINSNLSILGPTLISLTWQSAYSIHQGQPSGKFITSVTTPDAANVRYVELGLFKDGSNKDYFMVVNRRTVGTENRNIIITFDNASSREITDVATGKIWIVGPSGNFTENFTPGEGKLFKVVPATWSGTKILSGNALVRTGATLTINGNTEIKTSPITFESGSTVKVAAGASVTFKNNVQINGTSSSRVLFTSQSGTSAGSWGNLIFNNCNSSSAVNYAKVQYGSGVQILNDANITFQNSQIQNCTQGIYFYNCEPLIQNNSITDVYQNGIIGNAPDYYPQISYNTISKTSGNPYYKNYSGINLGSSTIGYVTQNDISGYDYGLCFIGGVTSYLSDYSLYVPVKNNRLAGNNKGVVVGWGSYTVAEYDLGLNSIYGNTNYAAFVYQYSALYARYNWWGGTTPTVYVDGSSNSYTANSFSFDPWNPPGGGEEKLAAIQPSVLKTKVVNDNSSEPEYPVNTISEQSFENSNDIRDGLRLQKNMRHS